MNILLMQFQSTFWREIVVGNPIAGARGVFLVESFNSNLLAVEGNDISICKWSTPSPVTRSIRTS